MSGTVVPSFTSIASADGVWRNFIGGSIPSVASEDDCAVHCYQRGDCGYYVHDVGSSTCHVGNVDRTTSVLTPLATDSATVKALAGVAYY